MAQGKTRSNSNDRTAGGDNGKAKNGAAQNGVSHSAGADAEEALLDEVSADASDVVDETEGSQLPPDAADAAFESPSTEETAAPAAESVDADPAETEEWLESLRYVLESKGPQRVNYLLGQAERNSPSGWRRTAVQCHHALRQHDSRRRQPPYPGNREIERRIKSIIRWNAMAMVVRANREHDGIGGHISTYASAATLYEVAFNHFFNGRGDDYSGDQIYFQGHASPGMYSRAFLEGRLTEDNSPTSARSCSRKAACRAIRIPG